MMTGAPGFDLAQHVQPALRIDGKIDDGHIGRMARHGGAGMGMVARKAGLEPLEAKQNTQGLACPQIGIHDMDQPVTVQKGVIIGMRIHA
jgi:hypothetical protein